MSNILETSVVWRLVCLFLASWQNSNLRSVCQRLSASAHFSVTGRVLSAIFGCSASMTVRSGFCRRSTWLCGIWAGI